MEKKLEILTRKKQELDKHQPLPLELVKNLEEWLMVELTYSSNAIEGNTLTRLETAEVLEKGLKATIPGKPLKDQIEAINHKKALELIKILAKKRKGHQFITEDDIRRIHQTILKSINDSWAGRYRQIPVFVKGVEVEFPPSEKVPSLMKEFVCWLESQQETHPVRVAADAHFKLVSIHPFVDGNGRTGRLLMNLILLLNGYPLTIIKNEERIAYLESVYSGQKKRDLRSFYKIIERAVERSLNMYLKTVSGL